MKRSVSLIASALLSNLLLFTVFFLFTSAIYDTNEDLFVLYLSSGGFGGAPTALLHYNFGLHFFIGLMLKWLFTTNPMINWYTWILICSHYVACSVILFRLLHIKWKLEIWLFYLMCFVVFECRLLLQLNFTNTAILLAIAGLITLLPLPVSTANNSMMRIIMAMLLLIAASFFRIHVLIPLTGLSLPFLFTGFNSRTILHLCVFLCITTGVIFILNQLHQSYYASAIPGWKQEEHYRQTIYKFYNDKHLYNPAVNEEWHNEYSLISNQLILDTLYLSTNKLNLMYAALKQKGNTQFHNATVENKWFWINNRLYFGMVLCFLLFSKPGKLLLVRAGIAMLIAITGLAYLQHTAKLSNYLIISCSFLFILLVILCSGGLREKGMPAKWILPLVMLLFTTWGLVRNYKVNSSNLRGINDFKSQYAEIQANRDKLFVLMNDAFALQKFYIFDVPENYRLDNILGYEQFILNIYKPVLSRFNIPDIGKLPLHHNVLFYGKRMPALENYFLQVAGDTLCVTRVPGKFRYNEVYTFTCDY